MAHSSPDKHPKISLKDIVCGIDGSHTALEAARQATALATSGGRLHFVCVAWTVGEAAATRMANITPARAEAALGYAVAIATQSGMEASSEVMSTTAVEDALLAQAESHDLLVIGCHGHSRVAGIVLGSSATLAAHRAAGPVLIARPSPDQALPFPKKMLVASDGSPGSALAVEAAAGIARRHDSQVLLLQVEEQTAEARRELAQQVVRLSEVTGHEPTVIEERDHVPRTISQVAEREQVSLVVVGSRGLGGARALGSVSERVVHEAPCSVLIVRPRGGDASHEGG